MPRADRLLRHALTVRAPFKVGGSHMSDDVVKPDPNDRFQQLLAELLSNCVRVWWSPEAQGSLPAARHHQPHQPFSSGPGPDRPVDQLTDDVELPDVAGVLLQQVEQDVLLGLRAAHPSSTPGLLHVGKLMAARARRGPPRAPRPAARRTRRGPRAVIQERPERARCRSRRRRTDDSSGHPRRRRRRRAARATLSAAAAHCASSDGSARTAAGISQ